MRYSITYVNHDRQDLHLYLGLLHGKMSYVVSKQTNTCVGYLNDAVEQAITAWLTKGERRKEAGISSLVSFGGFLLCTALMQETAPPHSSCHCSSKLGWVV